MNKYTNLSKKQLSASAALPGIPRTSPILFADEPIAGLHRAHEAGFSAIELHIRENAAIDCERIMAECDRLQMSISLVVTGRLAVETGATLTHAEPEMAKRAQDGVMTYVDIAKKLRSNLLIGWIRGPRPDGMCEEAYEDRLAAALRPICEYAQTHGVTLLIEALNRYEINSFHRGEEICAFIEKFNLPACGLLLDVFHMNLEEADMGDAIRTNQRLLRYVHFADSNRHFPGAGHMDIDEVLAALDEIHFDGWLSTECLPEPDYESAIRGAQTYFAARLS